MHRANPSRPMPPIPTQPKAPISGSSYSLAFNTFNEKGTAEALVPRALELPVGVVVLFLLRAQRPDLFFGGVACLGLLLAHATH